MKKNEVSSNNPVECYRQIIDSDLDKSIASAAALQKYIETETARYHGYFVRTLYMPKIFTEDMVRYIEKNASVMYKILEKIIYKYRTSASYRRLFGFEKELEELVLRPIRYDCVLPMARIDIFFNEDDNSFKFCEFNTDGSSAMNEDKELNEAISMTDAYEKFAKSYDLRTFELFDSWVREFMRIYGSYDRKVRNPRVSIVDFFNDGVSREFTNFKKAFENAGIDCCICDITALRYENGALLSPDGKRIHAVYRRAVTCDIMKNYNKVLPFIEAVKNNDVCLIGDFVTQIVHNKIVFKVLWDDMTMAFLTSSERKYVKDHIPYTTLLTEEAVSKHNVLGSKNKWVIKPEDSYASKGVFAGVEFSNDEEWKKTVLDNTGNHYLLQEYCEPYASWNIDLTHDKSAVYRKYSNITGVYMYGGKMAGLYSRIAKNSIISTQYSEMSLPTVVVSEKKLRSPLKTSATR